MRSILFGIAVGSIFWGAVGAQAQPPARLTPVPEKLVVAEPAGVEDVSPAPESGASWDEPASSEPAVFRFTAEALIWWIKDGPVPVPLVTGDSDNGAEGPFTSAGLADPSTIVLFGNTDIDYGAFYGGRFGVSWVLGPNSALETTGFFFISRREVFKFASNDQGLPVIFRPIITSVLVDETLNDPFAGPPPNIYPPGGAANAGSLPAFPDNFEGGALVESSSRIWGIESNVALHLLHDECLAIDGLVGFRYLNMREDLEALDVSRFLELGGGIFLGQPIGGEGTILNTFDSFATRNHFYGGQVGVRVERQHGSLYLAGSVKIALGGTHEKLELLGGSVHVDPVSGVETQAPGGVLVPPFNIGESTRNEFAIVPQFTFKLGCQLTSCLRVYLGYDFLYWSQVLRPGEQIDLVVRDDQNPISPRFGLDDIVPQGTLLLPNPPFRQSDFWAQGVSLGIDVRY